MTRKELVPDAASLDEIADRVNFLAAVQEGPDRGESIPHEELKRQLASWPEILR